MNQLASSVVGVKLAGQIRPISDDVGPAHSQESEPNAKESALQDAPIIEQTEHIVKEIIHNELGLKREYTPEGCRQVNAVVLTENYCWVYVFSTNDTTQYGTIFYRVIGKDIFHYDNFTYEMYQNPIPCDHKITKMVAFKQMVIIAMYNSLTGDSDIRLCHEDGRQEPIEEIISALHGTIDNIAASEYYFVAANEQSIYKIWSMKSFSLLYESEYTPSPITAMYVGFSSLIYAYGQTVEQIKFQFNKTEDDQLIFDVTDMINIQLNSPQPITKILKPKEAQNKPLLVAQGSRIVRIETTNKFHVALEGKFGSEILDMDFQGNQLMCLCKPHAVYLMNPLELKDSQDFQLSSKF